MKTNQTDIVKLSDLDVRELAVTSLEEAVTVDPAKVFEKIYVEYFNQTKRYISSLFDDASQLKTFFDVEQLVAVPELQAYLDNINGTFVTYRDLSSLTKADLNKRSLVLISNLDQRIPKLFANEDILFCLVQNYGEIIPIDLPASYAHISVLPSNTISREIGILSFIKESESISSLVSTFQLCLTSLYLERNEKEEFQEESEEKITIGIPTRNRIDCLVALLESIQKQTYSNYRLIIADDGDEYDLESELRARVPNLEFEVIQGEKHSLPVNRQTILDAATTEFVLMCDDDHIMEPDCVEQLVTTIQSDSNAAIACAIWPESNEEIPCIDLSAFKDHPDFSADLQGVDGNSHFWWKRGCYYFRTKHVNSPITETEMAGGGCLIYRKSMVQTVGGFPRDYSSVSFREDTDMSYRLYLAGYKILVNSDAVAYHSHARHGGTRDHDTWAPNFVEDGLRFLNKLSWWRERASQLDAVKKDGIKVLVFFDEVGWAWWHRAHQLKKNLGPEFQVDIAQVGAAFNPAAYHIILVFDAYLLDALPPIPPSKLIVANSCPKLITDTSSAISSGRAAGSIINNLQTFIPFREDARYFCCQNGVDTDLFYPSQELPKSFKACWIGNAQSIGNKGLDIIEAACEQAGVELVVCDVSKLAHVSQALSQEQLRDSVYHEASVLLCASQWEGTPNPALEALACGIPVITTPVGNMPELISNGENGFLVERNVESFVHALKEIQNIHPQSLRFKARESILRGWTWKEQIKKYEACFSEVTRRARFGDAPSFDVDMDQVDHIVSKEMKNQMPPIDWRRLVSDVESGVSVVDNRVYQFASAPEPNLGAIYHTFKDLPDFVLHIGNRSNLERDAAGIQHGSLLVSITDDVSGVTEVAQSLPSVSRAYVFDVEGMQFEAQAFAAVLLRLEQGTLLDGLSENRDSDKDFVRAS